MLALGLGRFRPRRLGLDREDYFEGRGLAYRLPPIEDIRVKHAVIVGGGDTALDTALSLQQVTHVTVVHRRDEFRAFAHTQGRFEKAGIEVLTNAEVVALNGDEHLESIVVSLTDDSSVEIAADLVLVSIGQVPDLSGVDGWGLGIAGSQIEVDSAMQTGLPGVFAVGDFAAYPGKVKMIATAAAEGGTAAAAAERYLMTPAPAMTSRRIIRTYLAIAATTTLAQSLIWGINTLFLLERRPEHLPGDAGERRLHGGTGVLRGAHRGGRRHAGAPHVVLAGGHRDHGLDAAVPVLRGDEIRRAAVCPGVGAARPGLHLLHRRRRRLDGRRPARGGLRAASSSRSSRATAWSSGCRCSSAPPRAAFSASSPCGSPTRPARRCWCRRCSWA